MRRNLPFAGFRALCTCTPGGQTRHFARYARPMPVTVCLGLVSRPASVKADSFVVPVGTALRRTQAPTRSRFAAMRLCRGPYTNPLVSAVACWLAIVTGSQAACDLRIDVEDSQEPRLVLQDLADRVSELLNL